MMDRLPGQTGLLRGQALRISHLSITAGQIKRNGSVGKDVGSDQLPIVVHVKLNITATRQQVNRGRLHFLT